MSFENLKDALHTKISIDEKESLIIGYTSSMDCNNLIEFLQSLPSLWPDLSMSRTAKMLRCIIANQKNESERLNLVNNLLNIYNNKKLISLELQARRIEFLLNLKQYQECLKSITDLSRELKKHDDKINLIRLYVCESQAYYALRNINRARSSLTTARAMAVSTFCPIDVQALIDSLTGMYICDERNYETSYGYFIEALDGYCLEKNSNSVKVARYLILSKIVGEKYNEVPNMIKKLEDKVHNISNDFTINILYDVYKCCIERDLNGYNKILKEKRESLKDEFVERHLDFLYERLLESNIKKIIEPYKNIKINYIASMIGLNVTIIENIISRMILDGKIKGILDHSINSLVLFESVKTKNQNSYIDLMADFTAFARKV
ncbi:26S proteasome non-ATPase regulatory subunit 11 [Binucleata daphniae]